jgi:hypothetical protein
LLDAALELREFLEETQLRRGPAGRSGCSGFTTYPHRRRLKRRKGVHFARKLRMLLAQCEAGEIPVSEVTASVRSWVSHASHGNTVGLRKAILGRIRLRPPRAKQQILPGASAG